MPEFKLWGCLAGVNFGARKDFFLAVPKFHSIQVCELIFLLMVKFKNEMYFDLRYFDRVKDFIFSSVPKFHFIHCREFIFRKILNSNFGHALAEFTLTSKGIIFSAVLKIQFTHYIGSF